MMKSVVGTTTSAVGMMASAVDMMANALGMMTSAVGMMASAVGMMVSALGMMTNAVDMLTSAVASRRAGTNGSGSILREDRIRISGAQADLEHHMRTRLKMARATSLSRGLFGASQMSL
jgi:hypothetical protein